MDELLTLFKEILQLVNVTYLVILIIIVQFVGLCYFTYFFTKRKTINDKQNRFNNFIAHSHILIYLRNNVRNLYYFLGYLTEDDLNYIIINEGDKIVNRLNLMEVNGLMNDLNTYLAEYYNKDFKNLKKLNRLNRKIRRKELRLIKKRKSNLSKNFYLTYFELRKLRRNHDKHEYFDREKVKTSYKEFKI